MDFIRLAPYDQLLTHTRFFVTLRSSEGKYHSLIIFRLSSSAATRKGQSEGCDNAGSLQGRAKNDSEVLSSHPHHQLYAMEAACPHLGADLSHAELEEVEGSTVAVCPWHRYDFDLRSGQSETGLRACTYVLEVRTDADEVDQVWIETPQSGRGWCLDELRPVSEEFPGQPHTSKPTDQTLCAKAEQVVPATGAPTTLMQWAVLILNTPDPTLKVQRTKYAVDLFSKGELPCIGHDSVNAPQPPAIPLREENYMRNTVDPRKLAKRKNAAVMLHALANIEQWAIDLAWDIMARFGPAHPDLPVAFFSDFSRMALDESKHFTLLISRLAALSPATPYGSLPVHAGLWESATVTSHSLRARLAIIHLVHEARGLDVNPVTIERFRRSGDKDTVAALEIIHADEVTHVTTGHRWFMWMCEKQGVDPVSTFREEVRRGWRGDIKGPFNVEARETAGMTRQFYEDLRGELGNENRSENQPLTNDNIASSATVDIQYETNGR